MTLSGSTQAVCRGVTGRRRLPLFGPPRGNRPKGPASLDLTVVVVRFLALRWMGDEEAGIKTSRRAERCDEPGDLFDERGIDP